METIPQRLKFARIAAGYRTAKEFADKNGIPQPTYAGHESGGRNLTREVALRYAQLLHISVDWLLRGRKPSEVGKPPAKSADLENVVVVAEVQAGYWREAIQWPEERWKHILVPPDSRYRGLTKYGLEVVGPSMDLLYPHGSFVICVNLIELGRHPKSGERVHVQRRRADGMVEAAIKEYVERDDGSRWLVPRSSDPAYQAPLRIDAGADGNLIEECQIVGLVIGSYRTE